MILTWWWLQRMGEGPERKSGVLWPASRALATQPRRDKMELSWMTAVDSFLLSPRRNLDGLWHWRWPRDGNRTRGAWTWTCNDGEVCGDRTRCRVRRVGEFRRAEEVGMNEDMKAWRDSPQSRLPLSSRHRSCPCCCRWWPGACSAARRHQPRSRRASSCPPSLQAWQVAATRSRMWQTASEGGRAEKTQSTKSINAVGSEGKEGKKRN
jgi:hypothetical protein